MICSLLFIKKILSYSKDYDLEKGKSLMGIPVLFPSGSQCHGCSASSASYLLVNWTFSMSFSVFSDSKLQMSFPRPMHNGAATGMTLICVRRRDPNHPTLDQEKPYWELSKQTHGVKRLGPYLLDKDGLYLNGEKPAIKTHLLLVTGLVPILRMVSKLISFTPYDGEQGTFPLGLIQAWVLQTHDYFSLGGVLPLWFSHPLYHVVMKREVQMGRKSWQSGRGLCEDTMLHTSSNVVLVLLVVLFELLFFITKGLILGMEWVGINPEVRVVEKLKA